MTITEILTDYLDPSLQKISFEKKRGNTSWRL